MQAEKARQGGDNDERIVQRRAARCLPIPTQLLWKCKPEDLTRLASWKFSV